MKRKNKIEKEQLIEEEASIIYEKENKNDKNNLIVDMCKIDLFY